MKLVSHSICKKSLDFQPDKPWPENWPGFAWEKILISGFTHDNRPVLNFQSEDVKFLHLFHSCYPRLNLSEMGRIISNWENMSFPEFSWKDFFMFYDLRNTEILIKQLKILINTPSVFQNWVCQKELHPSALRVLNSLQNIKTGDFLFQWIAEKNLSQSLGIKILELGVELILMDIPFTDILKPKPSPEKLIQLMEQKRKPVSTQYDDTQKKKLESIMWPTHATGQWCRKGDRTGLEIKVWSQNQKEWEEKINKITKMKIFNHVNKALEK